MTRIKNPQTGRMFYDLTGARFGRWTVLERNGWEKEDPFDGVGRGQSVWRCRCDCGRDKDRVIYASLVGGRSESCGCIRSEMLTAAAKHGRSRTRLYHAWSQMKDRCSNPNRKAWKNYGGRGIKVCQRWVENFEAFAADMGEPEWGQSLDRFPDKDGDYEPGNCRWADTFMQARNTRANRWFEWRGETRTLTDIARMEGVAFCSFRNKVTNGMSVEEAVNDCRNRGLIFVEKAKIVQP